MALADTSKAIGAVSRALKQRIDLFSGVNVSIGRPSGAGTIYPHLNLFLYEIVFDPHLRNTSLEPGGRPPLWVVLKYLLTAFESETDSDSDKAHDLLGAGLRAVNTDDLLSVDTLAALDARALSPNPSPLHVTFDEAPPELLAKLMQGPDDKVRLSACFQVRPVMITSTAQPDLSLLVGVDYTRPPTALADPYVGLDVIPSMGPTIDSLAPIGFEVGETVTILGSDLHLADLSVMLGPVELPVVMQQPDRLQFLVDPVSVAAAGISAGSYPIAVVQTLIGTGKKRKSRPVIGNLVPTLTAVALGAVVVDDPTHSHYDLVATGVLLGVAADDTLLAFYRDGRVSRSFDVFAPDPVPLPPGQPSRQMRLASDAGVPAGDYQVMLLVNGQQAPQSPRITLTWP